MWADAHNHLQDPRLRGHLASGGGYPCIVNATHEEDWEDVLAITAEEPVRRAALGIHPWYADEARTGWDERLGLALEANPSAGIGECGLDSKAGSVALEKQMPVFTRQLRLARELDRSVTIHLTGAWGALLDALDREPPPRRWLMHSFNGSPEIAERLAAMGACFSISGRAMHPSGEKIFRSFRAIPAERILVETDAPNQPPPALNVGRELPDGLNAPENLALIGEAVAGRLGFDPACFARITMRNFACFAGVHGGREQLRAKDEMMDSR